MSLLSEISPCFFLTGTGRVSRPRYRRVACAAGRTQLLRLGASSHPSFEPFGARWEASALVTQPIHFPSSETSPCLPGARLETGPSSALLPCAGTAGARPAPPAPPLCLPKETQTRVWFGRRRAGDRTPFLKGWGSGAPCQGRREGQQDQPLPRPCRRPGSPAASRARPVLGAGRTATNPFGLPVLITAAPAEDLSPSSAFPKWNMQALNIKGSLLCLTRFVKRHSHAHRTGLPAAEEEEGGWEPAVPRGFPGCLGGAPWSRWHLSRNLQDHSINQPGACTVGLGGRTC